MIQEDKDLLLKDLCARLSHGIKVNVIRSNVIEVVTYINPLNEEIWINDAGAYIDIEEVKPYLRPISSMTEEEEIYYNTVYTRLKFYEKEDWLNAHHFDYRGLIEKGLAIKVTEDNNPYKE